MHARAPMLTGTSENTSVNSNLANRLPKAMLTVPSHKWRFFLRPNLDIKKFHMSQANLPHVLANVTHTITNENQISVGVSSIAVVRSPQTNAIGVIAKHKPSVIVPKTHECQTISTQKLLAIQTEAWV
jgi:hypothetical protein